jgi:hypothetical protein
VDKHIAYQKLCEASEQAGCPVCRLTLEAVASYLDHLMYADVNVIRLREQLRLARGFCPEHARQTLAIGHALGVAIIYKDVIDNLARALAAGRYQTPAPWHKLREARRDELATAATTETVSSLSAQRTCPACAERSMIEDVFLGTMDEHLDGDPPFVEILRQSEGLCLPHFRRALELVRSRRAYDVLADLQLGWWRSLSAELAEFIRKNDYRFRHEGFAEEGDAWLRAVRRVIGEWEEPRRM